MKTNNYISEIDALLAEIEEETKWEWIDTRQESLNLDYSDFYDEEELRIRNLILQHTVSEGHNDWFDPNKDYVREDFEYLGQDRKEELDDFEKLSRKDYYFWKSQNGDIIKVTHDPLTYGSGYSFDVLEVRTGPRDDDFDVYNFNPFAGFTPDNLPDVLNKEKIEWLVDGLFVKNAFHEICGPSKSGKSQFSYQLAYCLQNGKDFFGQKCQQANVLYIDWELMQLEIHERYSHTKAFYGDASPIPYTIMPLFGTDYSIDTAASKVRAYLKSHPEIEVVFFDNWYSFFDGNNNDSSDVKKGLRKIADLSPKVTKFLVCHTNKADGKDGGNKDPIFSAAGSNAFGAFAHEIASIENKNDGKIVRISGRMVSPTQVFACRFGEETHFQFSVIEDESARSKLLSGKTGKTKEELMTAYPELCGFIGEEGKTISAIQKQFPDETDASLKEKGFYTEKNKERLRQGFVSGRWYTEDPKK